MVFVDLRRLIRPVSIDRCQNWYHISCIGVAEEDIGLLDQYVCPVCEKGVYSIVCCGSVEMSSLMYNDGPVSVGSKDPSVTLKTCYKDKCQREGCKRPGRGALSKYVALAFPLLSEYVR